MFDGIDTGEHCAPGPFVAVRVGSRFAAEFMGGGDKRV